MSVEDIELLHRSHEPGDLQAGIKLNVFVDALTPVVSAPDHKRPAPRMTDVISRYDG